MFKSCKIVCVFSFLLIVFIIVSFVFLNNTTEINSKKSYNVTVIVKTASNSTDFWKSYGEGVKAAADEYNINFKIVGTPTETMTARQIDIVNHEIAQRPDAIILSAIDYKQLAPVAKKVVASGITLISTDSDVDYPGKTSFIATDNVQIGKKLGHLLDSHIGTSAKYMIIEHFSNTGTDVDRVKGIESAVTSADKRLSGIYSCNASTANAKAITIKQLSTHPDIKGIVATNEVSALGVAEAVKQMGLTGKICVVCCDSSIELVKYMEEGVIQNFVVQRPFNIGYMAIKFAYESLRSSAVPQYYDTGSVVVDPENIYTSESQKLLFPFNYN